MEYFINYLLESSVILGVLTIFYRLVMHQEPLFKFNRIFLLLSLLLATVIPFIHVSLNILKASADETAGFVNLLDTVNVYAGDVRNTVIPAIAKSKSFGWLYLLGAIGLLFRLFLGIVRLGGLSKKATWVNIKGIKIADLPGSFNPFSFFHVIFINRSLYSDDDLDKILTHEMAHVKFKHSIDVLLFEILLIVQWFNPFAWLTKHLLKELHEFQADRSVLKDGASVGSYKNLLLFQATGARLLPVNNFNQSITKKRFVMMTNKTIKNKAFIKTLAASLMIVGVGFFFSCDNKPEEEIAKSTLKGAEIEQVFKIVEVMPEFPEGEFGMRKFIAMNVKYPTDAQEKGAQGRVYVHFVVSKTGEVKDVELARTAGFESLDQEAMRVIKAMPKWNPGMQRGRNVAVKYTVPINFVLQSKDGEKSNEDTKDQKSHKNEVVVVSYNKH